MMIYRVHLGHREALTFLTLGLALLPIVMTVMHIPAVDAEGGSRMDVRYGGMIAIFAILVYLPRYAGSLSCKWARSHR